MIWASSVHLLLPSNGWLFSQTSFPVNPTESNRSWSGMNMIKFGFSSLSPFGLGGCINGCCRKGSWVVVGLAETCVTVVSLDSVSPKNEDKLDAEIEDVLGAAATLVITKIAESHDFPWLVRILCRYRMAKSHSLRKESEELRWQII